MLTHQNETARSSHSWVRPVPALTQTVHGNPAVFLDGPGGPSSAEGDDAVSDYLKQSNANITVHLQPASAQTPSLMKHVAPWRILHCHPNEVAFGPNMTTLTYAVSRAIGRELAAGDEILLTRLDHDANVSPWLALEERGVKIQFIDIREDDCTLNMDDLISKITDQPSW